MSKSQQDQLIRFRCQCGAVLSAPASLAGRKGKCKTCGAVQVIPPPEESLRKEESPDEEATRIQEMCNVCQTVIEDDDERTTCDACQLPFHVECWTENLGCSAYGCENVNALKSGPDIQLGPLPSTPLRPYRRQAVQTQEDDLPVDHLLLAASAVATVVGILTCGAPSLIVVGLAAWRIAVNHRQGESVRMPALSLALSVVGVLVGLCLSVGFWTV